MFTSAELGLALGARECDTHRLPCGAGRRALDVDVERLSGFRPLFPESWREEPSIGTGASERAGRGRVFCSLVLAGPARPRRIVKRAHDGREREPAEPGPPLTLKPRPGGSVSTGTVKQSFSHGRSKTVVVETKRRASARAGQSRRALAGREAPAGFDVRGPQPPGRVRAQAPASDPHALSEDERRAARRSPPSSPPASRPSAPRAEAGRAKPPPHGPRRSRQGAAAPPSKRRQLQPDRRRRAARRAPPAPVAEAAAEPAAPSRRPCRSAAGAARRDAASGTRRAAPERRTRAPKRRARRRAPTRARRRPARPAPTSPTPRAATTASAPPPIGPTAGPRGRRLSEPRPAARAAAAISQRPARGRLSAARWRRRAAARGRLRGDRPAGRPGETVRYSALSPRPGPRPTAAAVPAARVRPARGRPAPPPAGPEIQRATRQTPRPGSLNLDRRPDFDEEDADRNGQGRRAGKAVSRTKGEPQAPRGPADHPGAWPATTRTPSSACARWPRSAGPANASARSARAARPNRPAGRAARW